MLLYLPKNETFCLFLSTHYTETKSEQTGCRTTSLGADLLRSEQLGCLESKDGVALLNDLEVVVIVTEGAMEAIVVHFSENNLSSDGESKKPKTLNY